MDLKKQELSVRHLVLVAMTDALLIALQLALGFIAGVELVTTTYVCFFHTFGKQLALWLGIVFSLTRCLIYGFYPSVIVLYLLYYLLFPNLLMWMRNEKRIRIVGAGSILASGLVLFPINPFFRKQSLFAALLLTGGWLYGMWKFRKSKENLSIRLAVQAFSGVLCFTLMDIFVSSLFFGLSVQAILAYAAAGIPVFLLQASGAVLGTLVLAKPLCEIMKRGQPVFG